ncbi:MAG: phosphotransferase, partial [Bacteroidetes bacterium]|nr:phosphotransferase [Bacteroidota bacterium]
MVSKQKEKKLVNLFEKWSGETAQRIIALPRSGSDREYYRIVGIEKKAIAAYNPDKKENQAFVSFARHFGSENLPVPEIYAVREEENIYLLQDLGNTTLYSFLLERRIDGDFPEDLMDIYKKVLSMLVKFQVKGGKGLDFTKCYPRDSFDLQSMKWDMHYFKYYFLKLAQIPFNEQLLEDDFETFAHFLLEADRDYFLYRDFQSRNVMLIDNEPFFIDYQGGRKGALQYDLASLLYDAKADIPADTRKQLLLHYIEELQKEIEVDADKFTSYYWGYVYIRIMQALGAYGFRGFYERKEHFLQSIPFAINNLEYLLNNVELPVKLPALTDAFHRLTKAGKLRKIADTGTQLTVRVNSFSFKRGIPVDESGHGGGFIFDCRAIENPGRYKEFHKLTGKDKKVKEFLDAEKSMNRFLEDSFRLVDQSVENYLERGFTHLMISFGCTGGRHRSVYAAEKLMQYLKKKYNV